MKLTNIKHSAIRVMAGLVAAASIVTNSMAAELTVTVKGVAKAEGNLIVNVYKDSDDWLSTDEGAATKTFIVDLATVESLGSIDVMVDLPSGVYAATAIHDMNADGKLAKNWMGIPKEPVGQTGNSKKLMGPPKFKSSAFTVDALPVAQEIVIVGY